MKTIENHKAFPYIAWATFVLFAAFTWYLAIQLQETAAYLDGRTDAKIEALGDV